MKENKYTIDAPFTHEITIEKSRFITHLFPTDTAEEAKDMIQQVKKQYADASHNCSAYVIEHETTIQKSSDDGEPAGTAGVPMLQALTSREMINITAVVTRYFGGIKLGAGGLIRAYSRAVLEALDIVPLMTYESLATVPLALSYDELNTIYVLQAKSQLFTIDELTYEPETIAHLTVQTDKINELEALLQANLFRFVELTPTQTIVKKVSKTE